MTRAARPNSEGPRLESSHVAVVRAHINSTALKAVLDALPDARRSGSGWSACCPSHADDEASLTIAGGTSRGVVLNCFVGCAPDDILRALGLDPREILGARVDGTASDGATGGRGPAP